MPEPPIDGKGRRMLIKTTDGLDFQVALRYGDKTMRNGFYRKV